MKIEKMRQLWLAVFVILGGAVAASAQNWPTHVVTMVIPFGPGSGTDIVGRILAAKISQSLGQQMIIEDLGGAGGTIAVSRVAKAPPDGYQVVLGAVDTFAQSQYLFKEPASDTVADFVPIGLAVEQPLLLVTRKNLPVANLKEFAAYLKANQAKMRFGSAGVGAAPYLACYMLTAAIGATSVTHVPYRAAAPALEDMIRGDIDYYCPLSISVSGMLDAKSVKPLAVLTRDRSPLYPDLPTAHEQGIDITDGYYWMGLFAPKGTPESVIGTLHAALGNALDDPAMQSKLREASAIVVAPERRSSVYLKGFLRDEITKWAGIMKASNVPQQ